MPLDAALKKIDAVDDPSARYIADNVNDPVTRAAAGFIRHYHNKEGVLAKAFGQPDDARRKVSQELERLGFAYNIDDYCLQALQQYIEENGDLPPNASKVIASAQILDRLPDPEFESGHRVVFAINEEGPAVVGASEVAISFGPNGTCTSSKAGKIDERFGAITKKTLWIMIDFPEKSELDGIEAQQQAALGAVAQVIENPAEAAANFDAVIEQIQALGQSTDIDVAATIQLVANAVEMATVAEANPAAISSPAVQQLSTQITQQLGAETNIPPVIAQAVQSVVEATIKVEQPILAATPATPARDIAQAVTTPQTTVQVVTPVSVESTTATTQVSSQTQDTSTPAVADAMPAQNTTSMQTPTADAATTQNNLTTQTPVDVTIPQTADISNQAVNTDTPLLKAEQAAPADAKADTTIVKTDMKQDIVQTPASRADTPATVTVQTIVADTKAAAPVTVADNQGVTPVTIADKAIPNSAVAQQVQAIAAQLPALVKNDALAQPVLEKMAAAIKTGEQIPPALQKQIEQIVAKMPDGASKQDLSRIATHYKQADVVEIMTASPMRAFKGLTQPTGGDTPVFTTPKALNENIKTVDATTVTRKQDHAQPTGGGETRYVADATPHTPSGADTISTHANKADIQRDTVTPRDTIIPKETITFTDIKAEMSNGPAQLQQSKADSALPDLKDRQFVTADKAPDYQPSQVQAQSNDPVTRTDRTVTTEDNVVVLHSSPVDNKIATPELASKEPEFVFELPCKGKSCATCQKCFTKAGSSEKPAAHAVQKAANLSVQNPKLAQG